MAEVFLTQPLQIVVGSKWMSDDLFKRAASKDKHVHVLQGSNHMQLYDVPKYVDEAVSCLALALLSSAVARQVRRTVRGHCVRPYVDRV
jgi:hypothetical protein